jgi:hypothetical protein
LRFRAAGLFVVVVEALLLSEASLTPVPRSFVCACVLFESRLLFLSFWTAPLLLDDGDEDGDDGAS